nr:MAG TPA: repressor domain protein [Caudoviricetes sp.]
MTAAAERSSVVETDITPFAYGDHQVRVVTRDGEPWFVARDVCDVLAITNAGNVLAALDEDERSSIHIADGTSGNPNKALVSEAGLYSLILRSRKPEAKAFKRWVTHEVLPSIRKRGGYLTPEAAEKALTDPDFIIRLATSLKEERAKRQAAEAQIEADAPHTRFGRTISGTDGDLLVKQVADLITQGGYPISQVTLFKWLRNHGWLCNNKGRLWNSPTKWALERGYVRSTVLVVSTSRGDQEKTTPRITAAGQENLVDGWLTGRYEEDN